MSHSGDLVEAELRVGMLDVALAKLISPDHHTIEFPTLLLPENVVAGSIVKLQCSRAIEAEREDNEKFFHVQQGILDTFAKNLPKPPVLRARNVTQTSVVLEWDPIDAASADLHFLALYKGWQRLGLIPSPTKRSVTKVSNLEVDQPYEFQLVLATSAGTFEGNKLQVKTHKMTDLSGVVVCLGSLANSAISESQIGGILERLGSKPAMDTVKLETTHFVCTVEVGPQYERALEFNIPIVRPEWLKACERERRLVSVRGYYLNVDPPKDGGERSTRAAPVAPVEAPVETPKAPVEESEVPVETPEAPVETPKAPVEEHEAPVEEPEAPVEEHEAPVEEPEAPKETPEAPEKTPGAPEETPEAPEETPSQAGISEAEVEAADAEAANEEADEAAEEAETAETEAAEADISENFDKAAEVTEMPLENETVPYTEADQNPAPNNDSQGELSAAVQSVGLSHIQEGDRREPSEEPKEIAPEEVASVDAHEDAGEQDLEEKLRVDPDVRLNPSEEHDVVVEQGETEEPQSADVANTRDLSEAEGDHQAEGDQQAEGDHQAEPSAELEEPTEQPTESQVESTVESTVEPSGESLDLARDAEKPDAKAEQTPTPEQTPEPESAQKKKKNKKNKRK